LNFRNITFGLEGTPSVTQRECTPIQKVETKTTARPQRKSSKLSLSDSVFVSADKSWGKSFGRVEVLLCLFDNECIQFNIKEFYIKYSQPVK
jgi:hypothetical protein